MADSSSVNPQITDAEDNPSPQGTQAPQMAMAVMYQNLVHSSALAMQNAVQQQQNTWTVQAAVTAKLVQQILSHSAVPAESLYDLLDDFDDLDGDEMADLLVDDFDDEDDF